MKRKQNTIKKEVTICGVGLHSGKECSVSFLPAPIDTGVIIIRSDLPGRPHVDTESWEIVEKGRRTSMTGGSSARSQFEVDTVEHFFAVLKAFKIDNVIIEIDNEELPGLDGSSKEQANVLMNVGVLEQDAEKEVYELKGEISVQSKDASICALPNKGGLKISYTLDYPELKCSPQFVTFDITPENFIESIASARTFCMKSEAEALRAAGYGKGANTDNTLVMEGDSPKDNKFRFPDELARHKLLDLLGDLFLSGIDVNMHIVAIKSGHSLNSQFVTQLKEMFKEQIANAKTFDFESIRNLIPHRYPFLLVDKITSMTDSHITGIKNVTGNEPFFQGHFPQFAVMPGVLQIESMAQAAGLLLRNKNPDKGLIPMLLTVDKVKLRSAVVPGDQLRIEAEVLSMTPEKAPTKGKVFVTCFVEDKKVSEAEIKFVLVRK